LPNVTHGMHHVIRHVSIGLKQPKNGLVHAWADSGDLLLTWSPGRARTSLMRTFQSSMSASVSGPGFCEAGAGAGAAIVMG
jgi:hypothetical protein